MSTQNLHLNDPEDSAIALQAQDLSSGTDARLAMKGKLSILPARKLIEKLYQRRFTGVLHLRVRDKRKKMWFYQGEVFRIQSNLVPELFGSMLVDRNWINESDLKECLDLQKTESGSHQLLGEIVQEIHSVDSDEMAVLVEQQSVCSLFQAFTWSDGTYEAFELELKQPEKFILPYQQVIHAFQSLFEISATSSSAFKAFHRLESWHPEAQQVELSRVPLWLILAHSRVLSLNGIISVRRQNKLYEIVLKYGVPLTLYEGTFGQPRQTIVVRQASDEHERFFIEQLFKLFSFLTGNVHFRSLSHQSSSVQYDAAPLQFREETAVTKSTFLEKPLGLVSQMNTRFQAWRYRLNLWLHRFSNQARLRLERQLSKLRQSFKDR